MQVGLNAYALYKGFNDAICYISEGRYWWSWVLCSGSKH
jgi:hypothetical protein